MLVGRLEKFVVPPTRFFRDVFNKISAMEPFESFFRVLFSGVIDFERMRKTCTATLWRKKAGSTASSVVLSRHYIAIIPSLILISVSCRSKKESDYEAQ